MDDFYCKLCKVNLKSEDMWVSHVCGKLHLQNVRKELEAPHPSRKDYEKSSYYAASDAAGTAHRSRYRSRSPNVHRFRSHSPRFFRKKISTSTSPVDSKWSSTTGESELSHLTEDFSTSAKLDLLKKLRFGDHMTSRTRRVEMEKVLVLQKEKNQVLEASTKASQQEKSWDRFKKDEKKQRDWYTVCGVPVPGQFLSHLRRTVQQKLGDSELEGKQSTATEPFGQMFAGQAKGQLYGKFFKDGLVAIVEACSKMHSEALKKAKKEAMEQEEERQKLAEEHEKLEEKAAAVEACTDAQIAAVEKTGEESKMEAGNAVVVVNLEVSDIVDVANKEDANEVKARNVKKSRKSPGSRRGGHSRGRGGRRSRGRGGRRSRGRGRRR